MVGLWNSFFLLIYSMFNLSFVMKFCTRSTEEVLYIFFVFSLCVLGCLYGLYVSVRLATFYSDLPPEPFALGRKER